MPAIPVYTTQGGSRTATLFSGALLHGSGFGFTTPGSTGHSLIATGAGRLQTVIPHQAISGVAGFFYDSPVAALSGASIGISASGLPIIGVLPANTFNMAGTLTGPAPVVVGTPFKSGLCCSLPSGCAGVTIAYQAEAGSNPF